MKTKTITRICAVLLIAQVLPVVWMISWLFAPEPGWSWQWVPAVTTQLILYLASTWFGVQGVRYLRGSKEVTK